MQTTLTHAADLLRVHRATVGRAVERGELTGVWAASGRLCGVVLDERFRAWVSHPGAAGHGTHGRKPDPRVLTLREAAREKSCSHEAIRRAIVRGALRGVQVARAAGGTRCAGVRADALYRTWEPRAKFDRFGNLDR